jgi:F-type H+-transporting ATPase subunit gamma
MKMVSAAKLRKSQSLILKLRPYSAKMTEIVRHLGSGDANDIPYVRTEKKAKVLILVLTSNKGLCSTFNSNVIKAAVARVRQYETDNEVENTALWCFGKRGADALRKIGGMDVQEENDEIWDKFDFSMVEEVANRLMEDFIAKKYDRIEIIYNKFKNSATSILTTETFLPLSISKEEASAKNNDYIFEPNKASIIENIIPQSLKTQMYKCFLDSFASEHGTRMTSMHKATDNAQNLLKDLNLTYNKIRQSAITNEIIEICSGANALNE